MLITNHFQNSFSVGGKVDGGNSGIFIKNVIDASPAGRSAGLFTGDRILEVAGVSLTSSEQNVAVEAIKSSTSPIQFVVQSLQPAKVGLRPKLKLKFCIYFALMLQVTKKCYIK